MANNIDLATGDKVTYSDGSRLILEGVGVSGHRRRWKRDLSGYSCHGGMEKWQAW